MPRHVRLVSNRTGLVLLLSLHVASMGRALRAEEPSKDDGPAAQDAVFNTPAWRNTLLELDEWFSIQPVYNKKQVEEERKHILNRLMKMSPEERNEFQRDLDVKLEIVLGPEGRDILGWVEKSLAAAAPAYRPKLDLEYPNILRMTAAQLRQQLDGLQGRRSAARNQSAALEQARQARIAALQTEQRQQYEERERSLDRGVAVYGSGGYRSPYHPSGMRKYPDVVSRPAYGWGFGFW